MPNIQLQFRRGTAAEWTSANPTLAAGEMGIETDTYLFKIGTGSIAWNFLPYGGLVGSQGPSGVTGSQGIQGVQGGQGSQGIQGVTGPQGVQGIQGIQGFTGPTGMTGPTGTTGPTGPTGITGAVGIDGPQGTAGVTGSQGVQGVQGSQGTQGSLGPTGPQGVQGIQGIQGPTGPAAAGGNATDWASYKAVQTVDMSGNNISNVSRILALSGSASAPTYSFQLDASSGIHYAGTSQLAFDTSGIQRMTISTSNVTISNPLFARMPVTEVSGTSMTLASSNYSTYFYVTNSGFNAVTLPSTTATSDAGAFWTIMNSTASSLSITLTNTLNLVSPLIIPSNNAQSLVVSAVTSNTILLL